MSWSINCSVTERELTTDDIANNRSRIHVVFTWSWNYWEWAQDSPYWYFKIGNTTMNDGYRNFNGYGDENDFGDEKTGSGTLLDTDYTINHDEDGTKTISWSAGFQGNAKPNYKTTSGTKKLVDVPRASDLNTVSNFNFEDGATVSVTKKVTNIATDYITMKIGNNVIGSATILPDESSATINFSSTGLTDIYSLIASNTKTATVTIESLTKFGDDIVGTDSTTCTGTIAGTGRVKVSGTWKKAIPWVKVNGTWKRAVANYKNGDTWARGG